MNTVNQGITAQNECQRLREKIDRDGGTGNLSATELAFFQSVCSPGYEDLSEPADVVFAATPTIDNSGGNSDGTIMDDPDAGRPDDPDDANPAAPDPAITKE